MKWMTIRWPFGLSLNLLNFRKRRKNYIFKARWKYKSFFLRQQGYRKSLGKIKYRRLKVMFKNILNKNSLFKYLSFLKNIELRLDILLYRLKFSITPFSSITLLNKKIFLLNNNFNYKFNSICRIGDIISINWNLWELVRFIFLSKLRIRYFRLFLNTKRLNFRYKRYIKNYQLNYKNMNLIQLKNNNKNLKQLNNLIHFVKINILKKKFNRKFKRVLINKNLKFMSLNLRLNNMLNNYFYYKRLKVKKYNYFKTNYSIKKVKPKNFKYWLKRKIKQYIKVKKSFRIIRKKKLLKYKIFNKKGKNFQLKQKNKRSKQKFIARKYYKSKFRRLIKQSKNLTKVNSKVSFLKWDKLKKNYKKLKLFKTLKKNFMKIKKSKKNKKRIKTLKWKLNRFNYKRINVSKKKNLFSFFNKTSQWKLKKQRWLKHFWWISNKSFKKNQLRKYSTINKLKHNKLFVNNFQKFKNSKTFYTKLFNIRYNIINRNFNNKLISLNESKFNSNILTKNLKPILEIKKKYIYLLKNYMFFFFSIFFKIKLKQFSNSINNNNNNKNYNYMNCLKKLKGNSFFVYLLVLKINHLLKIKHIYTIPVKFIFDRFKSIIKLKKIKKNKLESQKSSFRNDKLKNVFNNVKYLLFLLKFKQFLTMHFRLNTKKLNLIDFYVSDFLNLVNNFINKIYIYYKSLKINLFSLFNYSFYNLRKINKNIYFITSLMIKNLTIKNNYKLFKLLQHTNISVYNSKKTNDLKSNIKIFYTNILKEVKEYRKEIRKDLKLKKKYKAKIIRSKKIDKLTLQHFISKFILKTTYNNFLHKLNIKEKKYFFKKLKLLKLLNTKKHSNFTKNLIFYKKKKNKRKTKNLWSLKVQKNNFNTKINKRLKNFEIYPQFEFSKVRKKFKKRLKKRNLKQYIEVKLFLKSKRLKKMSKERIRRRLSFPLNNPKSSRLSRHVLLKNKHIKKFNFDLLSIKMNNWYYLPSFIEMNFEILNFIILSNPLTENILTGFSYNSFLKSYIRFNKRQGF